MVFEELRFTGKARAIGVSKALALSTLRFGLGRSTSEEDVLQAAGHVAAQVLRLRRMS